MAERVRFEGYHFLKRIATLCDRIDRYKSRIDLAYNRLDALKAEIVSLLGRMPDDLLTPEMKRSVAGLQVRAFFQLYGQVNDLKRARLALYRKVAAVKKNWFGFLSNIEVALARKHHAALVREDLTLLALEKEAPGYKGRAFNKMLNNGSRGQYQKRASDKLLWNGVPEVDIPSWYTSRSCTTHGIVIDQAHRKGERLFLPCCDRHDHADEHAADTIAGYLFLKPKVNEGGRTGCLSS